MPTDKPTKNSKCKSIWGPLFKYGFPAIISIGLCYLLFTGFNFKEMISIIVRDCNFWWIAATLTVSVFSHIFRGMRWRLQLQALDIKAPLFPIVLSIFGTYAVNLVFPRLGEFWRTGYIAQRQNASFTTVFGSMIADRFADLLMVLSITFVTFLLAGKHLLSYLSQNEESYNRLMTQLSSPVLWLTIIAIIVLCGFLLWHFRESKAVTKLKKICLDFWNGFAVIVKMPRVWLWIILTFAVWGCYFFQLYLAFFAFPLTTEVVAQYGVTAVLVCFVFSSIAMGVPSNGGIGPWQWAIIFGLGIYSVGIPGLTPEYSASFANLVLGTQTLLLIALGLFTFVCIAIDKKRKNNTN